LDSAEFNHPGLSGWSHACSDKAGGPAGAERRSTFLLLGRDRANMAGAKAIRAGGCSFPSANPLTDSSDNQFLSSSMERILTMRTRALSLVLGCCAVVSGCDAGKVSELTSQVEQLRAENERLNEELQAMRNKAAQVEEIRKGYEEARQKFHQQLAGLTALLGAGAASPLPPFEGLKNSDWVGKLLPSAAANLGKLKNLKGIEQELLKGFLGGQPKEDP
jgi:outer membrane murein-binding lipoprotein Lpp